MWQRGRRWVVLAVCGLALVGPATGAAATGSHAQTVNAEPRIVPTLLRWQGGYGDWSLSERSRILLDSPALRPMATAFAQDLVEVTGLRLVIQPGQSGQAGDIVLRLGDCGSSSSSIGDEGYTLQADRDLQLCAHSRNGLFYASRTLLQMLLLDGRPAGMHRSLPRGSALDYPRYAERAVMFDVGRKFASPLFLQNYIRFMGWYKLNTLHLHLNDQVQSDDQSTLMTRLAQFFGLKSEHAPTWLAKSFRLKSNNPAFHDLLPPDGQYYTRQDWDQLEQVAAANAVHIVPEIDTPGHAGALAAARPDLAYPGGVPAGGTLDPGKAQTLAYVESVFAEFLPWFRSSVIHIGGDEVTLNQEKISVATQVNYLNRLGHFLQRHGKQVEVWGNADFAEGLDKSFLIQRWINWGSEAGFNWGEHGFRWTESYGDWYIVPLGPAYFNPRGLRGDAVYAGWDTRTPADADSLHGPTGGQLAVWNDKGTRDYDYAGTVHALLKDAIPAAGQVFWRGQARDAAGIPLGYAELRQSIKLLQYGPGVGLFERTPL